MLRYIIKKKPPGIMEGYEQVNIQGGRDLETKKKLFYLPIAPLARWFG